jgi:hypothetical protein
MNMFLTVTFLFVASTIAFFMFIKIERYPWAGDPTQMCGPYPSHVTVVDASNFFFSSDSITETTNHVDNVSYRTMIMIPFLCSIFAIIIAYTYDKAKYVRILEKAKNKK